MTNIALPRAYPPPLPLLRRFAMHDLGLAHTKPYRKCARVVGEVRGPAQPSLT